MASATTPPAERRRHTRHRCCIPALARTERDGVPGWLTDISRGGCLFLPDETDTEWGASAIGLAIPGAVLSGLVVGRKARQVHCRFVQPMADEDLAAYLGGAQPRNENGIPLPAGCTAGPACEGQDLLFAALDGLDTGAWMIDAGDRLLRWNDTAAALFGFGPDQVGQPLPEAVGALVAAGRFNRATVPVVVEWLAGRDHTGTVAPVVARLREGRWISIREQRGATGSGIGLIRDLSRTLSADREQETLLQRLESLAFHDPLTGLANRSLFDDRLRHALARSRRHDGRVAVLFVDLDDFKCLNDRLGHRAGDAMLVEVAKCLLRCVREHDSVARLGGDEFAIIIEGGAGQRELAGLVADRVVREVAALRTQGHGIGCSIGIHHCAPGEADPEAAMELADRALYRAKAAGKNRTALSG